MTYNIVYFNNRSKKLFSKLKGKHKSSVSEYIEKELVNDPYKNSKHLRQNLRGINSHKMGGLSNFRLIFVICERCREVGYDKILRCPDCNEMEDKTVKLILYDYRDKIYDSLERMLHIN